MRVTCVKILGPLKGQERSESPWVTLDREYLVIAISAVPDGEARVMIVTDDGKSVGWFDSQMFMTSDSSLPPNWTAKIGEGGVIDLAPAAWHAPGFWESYFDRDPGAERTFDAELELISASSNT